MGLTGEGTRDERRGRKCVSGEGGKNPETTYGKRREDSGEDFVRGLEVW